MRRQVGLRLGPPLASERRAGQLVKLLLSLNGKRHQQDK